MTLKAGAALALITLTLAACGGGGGGSTTNTTPPPPPTMYTIGGTLSSLGASTTVVLQDNGGNNLSLSANGAFTFTTSLASGSAYAVTVLTQPTGQTCTVSSGSGTANANVTTVAVSCKVNTYTIGGTITGVNGGGTVTLQDNGGDNISQGNGNFTFATALNSGAAYKVTVLTQPTAQTCTLTNATGNAAANISNVQIACANNLTIGGTIAGLHGGTVVLQNNLGDNLPATSATFDFQNGVPANSPYFVTVLTNPTGQTCNVTANPSGTAAANVSTVAITCTDNPAQVAIGGQVTGLTGAGLVLLDNGADDLAIAANGPFTFATRIANGSTAQITIKTQPAGQTCTITGNLAAGPGTSVDFLFSRVNCTAATPSFSLGGSVVGLNQPGLVLATTANNPVLVVPQNALSFVFPNKLATGTDYLIAIVAQPTGQTCVVTHADSTIQNADYLGALIQCIPNTTDPLSGTYRINGGLDYLKLNPDGTYIFASVENDSTCGPSKGNGVELGVYSYNKTTGAFQLKSNVLDTNGGCGVWDSAVDPLPAGTLHITGAGQGAVLTYTPAGNGADATLIPVPAVANTLVGSFGTLGFPVSLVMFGNDAHYLIAEVSGDPAGAGVEYGCYATQAGPPTTLTVDLNTTTCPVAVDTNSDAGLSGASGPVQYASLNPYIFVLGGTHVGIRSLPN